MQFHARHPRDYVSCSVFAVRTTTQVQLKRDGEHLQLLRTIWGPGAGQTLLHVFHDAIVEAQRQIKAKVWLALKDQKRR
jgi:hypothetical protein